MGRVRVDCAGRVHGEEESRGGGWVLCLGVWHRYGGWPGGGLGVLGTREGKQGARVG